MSVVAVCSATGSPAATTTATLLAAMSPAGVPTLLAECDPSGGDVGSWAQLPTSPGWTSALSHGDRSLQGLLGHVQSLPSGLRAVLAPVRSFEAQVAVTRAASDGFGDVLASAPDVVTVADCGRVSLEVPAWVAKAHLTLLLVRQSPVSPYATAALVERAAEALEVLQAVSPHVGVVLVGSSPYSSAEVAKALGVALFGMLPEDRSGAGVVAGGWSARGAERSGLAKAARVLAERVVGVLVASSNGHSASRRNVAVRGG